MNEQIELLKKSVMDYAGELRRESFVKAIDLAAKIKSPWSIVETGTYRGCDADGMSTRTMIRLGQIIKSRVYSVDINSSRIENAEKVLKDSEDECGHATFVCRDSVCYLSTFGSLISLLYLDSFDYSETDPMPSQLHQLAELGAAYGKLSYHAIVLLDDCNIPGGGKGELSSKFLLQRGWNLIHDGYQKLFTR